MAKKSVLNRNANRIKLSKINFEAREKLRKEVKTGSEAAVIALQKNRNRSHVRVRARCQMCGRSHGTYRKFGVCRVCLRMLIMRGLLPGARKASW